MREDHACALKLSGETLAAWQDRLLSARDLARLDMHVPACPSCRQRTGQFADNERRLRGQRELDPGSRIWRNVQMRLPLAPQRRNFLTQTRTVWTSAAAAAALITLAVVLAQAFHPRTGTSVSITTPTLTPVTTSTATSTPISLTATPTHPAGALVTAPIMNITMFSSTTGWGMVQSSTNTRLSSRIAHTVDGGHNWYDHMPSAFTVNQQLAGSAAVYPRSADEAWVWASYTASNDPTTALWHTTNGGATWTQHTVNTGAVQLIDFVDSADGWLSATPGGAAAGSTPIDVWHTTDGGVTWAKVAFDPVSGHTTGISFANTSTGFATAESGASNQTLISVSHDAGHTWNPVSLPPLSDAGLNEDVMVEPPVFTSATSGVLPVTYVTNAGTRKLVVYRTANAGTTWTLGPAITLGNFQATSSPAPISVIATGEVFAAAVVNTGSVTLYHLPAGASSWARINTNSGLLAGLTKLNFVDGSNGWAVTQSGLIGTNDGGLTWMKLHG
jgi:photosystem II stability/assembly factor-like uncharacterized protein/predicted anti-sigma-YlaC factor YlaD